MARGDRRLRTSTWREPLRSNHALRAGRGVCSDSRSPSGARTRRLRPVEELSLMNKSRPTPVTGEKFADVKLLHGDPEDLPLADEPTNVIIKNDLDAVAELAHAHDEIINEINKRIIDQRRVIEQLLVALFAHGHTLFVDVPDLAKTLLISTLAETLNLTFQHIQFTPDLMPTDITETEVLEKDHTTGHRIFRFLKGPVFTNL